MPNGTPNLLQGVLLSISELLEQLANWISDLTSSDEDTPTVAAFRLRDITSSNDSTHDYLQTLAANYNITIAGDESESSYTTIGWMFHLPKAESNNPTASSSDLAINRVEVGQLIVKIGQGPEHNIDFLMIALEHELEGKTYSELQTYSNQGKERLPILLHQIQAAETANSLSYVNVISNGDQDTLVEQLDFYDKYTDAIFFSRTQLFMMQRWLQQLQDTTATEQDVDIVFSGAKLSLGRLSSFANMLELETMNRKDGDQDFSEWFTLKAEIVPINEIDTNMPGSIANDLNTFAETLNELTGEEAEKLLLEMQCNLLNKPATNPPAQMRAPILFMGYSCPPAWRISSAIQAEIWNIMDTILPETNVKLDICKLLFNIRSGFSKFPGRIVQSNDAPTITDPLPSEPEKPKDGLKEENQSTPPDTCDDENLPIGN